ncbi:MAG TPA: hypothetical protein VE913_18760 [Longimicrobium sp.]|nr:hypothetical protein [Longimicrobium sp.]
MLALYSTDEHCARRLRAALPAEREVAWMTDWTEMMSRGSAHPCSVVHVEWPSTDPVVPRLGAFRARNPQHRMILVTPWEAGNARHPVHVAADEIVWLREIAQQLAPAVTRACAGRTNPVRCLARPFTEARHLPLALRAALAHACENDRPISSVQRLATVVGVDRRTLWSQWSRVAGKRADARLQDAVHWLLLLRALGWKTPDRRWADVAGEVGVHPHTLGRLARRYTGRTLPHLARERNLLGELFRSRVLDGILAKPIPPD